LLIPGAILAVLPNGPARPRKKMDVAIAGALGLFLDIFATFFLECWQAQREMGDE